MRGSAGNLVEWHDVYVYAVFASYFEAQFFDKNDTNSTVYIYAIFAITFVMRPVGSTCSFVVAIKPIREIIGYWAAVILVLRVAALVVLWIRRSMDESLSESHLAAIREGKDRRTRARPCSTASRATHGRCQLLLASRWSPTRCRQLRLDVS